MKIFPKQGLITNLGSIYSPVLVNIIGVGLMKVDALTLSDPGYFRQLTIRGGGGLKSPPPPPTISKTVWSIFTISYMCILPGVLGMFQLEFFKNSRF